MKLINFQIKNYKIIADTLPVKTDPRVTALVGKNESGKTAILKAMWKAHNVTDAEFDKLFDYPRDRYARDRKGTQQVTILDFDLTEKETRELRDHVPLLAVTEPLHITCTTFYEGEDQIRKELHIDGLGTAPTGKDAHATIEKLITATPEPPSDDQDSVRMLLTAALGQIDVDAPLWEPFTVAALESVDAALTAWIDAEAARAEQLTSEREHLSQVLARARQGNPLDAARTWAESNLPVFIYFDDYGQLETRIHLPTYLRSASSADLSTRTQTALFEWSHLDPDEILKLGLPRQKSETDKQVHRRQEKRRALLDSASFSLTGDWIEWWTEKRHKLHFDADGEDLVLKVSDQHNAFPIPFDERSHGFQWFFSFYLVFLVESQKAHKGAILLLDEPGLHLHPTLQSKLIDLFERVSNNNQLIYSTHLPFLIDGEHLERVRTVHLAGPEPQKTLVSNDVRPTGDRDTLFPIQAALGYSIAQTLFLGKRSLIVEGITDYWLLRALSSLLPVLDSSTPLHEETVLIPAGGTSRLMPLASIMLSSTTGVGHGRLLVLLDSDSEGRQAAKRMQDTFGKESSTLMLGHAIGLAEATIEDLIPRNEYADAVKRAGHKITIGEEEKRASTNVKAIESAFQREGLGKFGVAERASTALALIEEWSTTPSSVPNLAREKARLLIDSINGHFDTLLGDSDSNDLHKNKT